MVLYIPTIGLEIHAELKTKSKMFCGSPNDPNEKHPNVLICPICMGHPGVLPVINEEAVKHVLRVGLALNCEIPEWSKFDRKNYFYPDLPKGYQISQYDQPLCNGGYLDIPINYTAVSAEKDGSAKKFENQDSKFQIINSKRIRIRRVHLEEDTGRLIHPEGADYSLVDFNRAGVPLMELVTEPDIHSAEEAVAFAKELQKILRYLGASDADMEKGQLRVEVNISLREMRETETKQEHATETKTLGTKVEIKNLNSFRAAEGAIAYEIKRQTELIEGGGKVIQETRGWDDINGTTFSQRIKEEAHDYRYFPEPDLPPLHLQLPQFDIEAMRAALPELPRTKKIRFMRDLSIDEEPTDILVENKELADFFEKTATELLQWVREKGAAKLIDQKQLFILAANYTVSDLVSLINETGAEISEFSLTPENFAELLCHLYEGKISSRVAKDLLAEMFKTGADPSQLIHERGLFQISDTAKLEEIAKRIIKENSKPVEDYKNGKENALQFLVGKVMAETKGTSNPTAVMEIFKKLLAQ